MITPMTLMSTSLLRPASALVDERPDRHDPGVVDEHVERPEAALNRVEELGEAGAIGDVERQADRVRPEFRRRPLGQRAVDVADRHPRALGDQRGRGRPSDPTAPPVIATTCPSSDRSVFAIFAVLLVV